MLDKRFLVAYLSSNIGQKEIDKRFTKTSQPKLALARIKQIPILVPPISEQKKIAYVLSAVQEAKEKTEAVIEATKELKKSLMKYLFTYGPVSVEEAEKVKLKETEIGMMPENWNILTIGALGKILTGTTPSTKKKEYYGNDNMFISPADIGESKYVNRTAKSLSNKGLKVSRILPKDTVLVVCIGSTIGKTAMTITDNSTTNQQINAIIPNADHDASYIYYVMNHYSKNLKSIAGKVAIPIVNKSNFETFNLPIAFIKQQKKISEILSAIDNKLEAEFSKKLALDTLFKSLLNNLMTGKLRVNNLEFEK